MRSCSVFAFAMLLAGSALAQSPTYGVGRTPTDEEIRVEEGSLVYRRQCAACHGVNGQGAGAPRLVKPNAAPDADPWSLGRILPIRSPYATGVWDYINRGMPLNREGSLSADQVYALTAYLLNLNEVIPEDAVMDAESLPKVQMPNRHNFADLPDWSRGMQRLPGYPH